MLTTPTRTRLRLGAAGLSLALLATACGTATETAAPVETGTDAAVEEAAAGLPVLVADTVGGPQLDTNDLAGQDVVVWFWAPW